MIAVWIVAAVLAAVGWMGWMAWSWTPKDDRELREVIRATRVIGWEMRRATFGMIGLTEAADRCRAELERLGEVWE